MMNPVQVRHNNYRRLQYLLDKEEALSIAAEYIDAKIRGMRNILGYYDVDVPAPTDAASTLIPPGILYVSGRHPL